MQVVEKHIGVPLDWVVVNTAAIPPKALEVYARYHEQPVTNNVTSGPKTKVIGADIISRQFTPKAKSDTLIRSLIRHDSNRLAQVLMHILEAKRT